MKLASITFPAALALCLIGACSSNEPPTTQPSSMYDRQSAAINDPFDYSPQFDSPNISGGKINEYDSNGMRKDVDHVLNP